MNAVADEYLRAKAALVGVREMADGQALTFGLAQALGDLGSFGAMVSLTREAEALIEVKTATRVARLEPPREHVTFAVPPTPAVAERLDALGVGWEVKAFEESKHPRNRLGEWAHTGGGVAQMPSEWPEHGLAWDARWAKLPDDAPVWVFHSTDRQTAEKFLAEGIDPAEKPTNLNRQRYEAGDLEGVFFQPGAGLGAGLPVALQPGQTGGYGRQLLAIRVRKGDIQVSPEQESMGETRPERALRVGDAMTSAVIPPQDVVAVGEAGRDPSAVDVAGQLRDRGLLAKAVATATWNPTLHPRDTHGRWTHAGADLGRLFGQLDYSPDTLASHEGDFERDPDGAPVRWRQAHLDLVTAALRSFRRSPFAVQVHMNSAFEGRPQPPSGVGQRARAEAAALLWELEHGSRPNPVPLYRASAASVTAPDAWTEDPRVAQHLADLAGGEVITLPRAEGLGVRIDDYVHSGLDLGQRQWVMLPQDVAGLLQLDALTANRKAVDWNPTLHPRDRHGRFASTPGVSAEVQRVLDAVHSLKADGRSEPAKLETVGSLVSDAVNARADARIQALQTQRHQMESEWSDLGEQRYQISKQLAGYLIGPQHGRIGLTAEEVTARDKLLGQDTEIVNRQTALSDQIYRLRDQGAQAHRQATVDVLSQIRPMGGEFRTAGTHFNTTDGLAPQAAHDAHEAALADIQHLMPTAWVEQMNLQGSVHWDLWKQCRGWQRELPNITDSPVLIQRRDFPTDEAWRAEVTRRAQAAGVRPQDITYSGLGSLSGVETRFAYWLPGPDSEVKAMAGDGGVYLHELVHRVQLLNPSGPLHDAQVRYLNERTGAPSAGWDEKIRELRNIYPGAGYSETERAIEDDFISAYYGKVYGPNYGTVYNELLTMSMQDLFFNNERLRTQDPSTYQWILGTLAAL